MKVKVSKVVCWSWLLGTLLLFVFYHISGILPFLYTFYHISAATMVLKRTETRTRTKNLSGWCDAAWAAIAFIKSLEAAKNPSTTLSLLIVQHIVAPSTRFLFPFEEGGEPVMVHQRTFRELDLKKNKLFKQIRVFSDILIVLIVPYKS